MSYINAIHDTKNKRVIVWERNESFRETKIYPAPYYFYIEESGIPVFEEILKTLTYHDRLGGEIAFDYGVMSLDTTPHKELFSTFEEKFVFRLTFKNIWAMKDALKVCKFKDIKTYESDVSPEQKVLSANYYQVPAPKLNVTYIDIETDYDEALGFCDVETHYAPINSVTIHHDWKNETILIAVPPPEWDPETLDATLFEIADIRLVENEEELIRMLFNEFEDSDGICGWNSDFFDLPYIAKRANKISPSLMQRLSFNGAHDVRFREVEIFGREQTTVDISGRLRMDYLALFKKFEMTNRATYKLDAISNELLPDLPKLEYEGSLAKLYKNDFNFFMRYNIRDVECLLAFEEKLGYVELANVMYHESTGFFANINGTIRLAEMSLVTLCHYEMGIIVPDCPVVDDSTTSEKAHGALVLQPKAGMHELIGSIDIASLYPSAIRSINISPEMLVGQFIGTVADFEAIAANDTKTIALQMEDTGELIKYPANEWREILHTNCWSVSGYGTVFSQEKKGIIPTILEKWYDTRKEYNALKAKAKDEGDHDKAKFYDKMQYCYKIKLNSLYGALLNKHFRFFDPRLGESTTGTGRAILKYMCGKTNEILCDEFDPTGDAVLYGDTDSVYFSTFAKDVDEGVVVADSVAEIVNGSFQQFMQDSFLCQPEFDSIIKAEREVLASRGIFVTPKRYILKLKNKDGYPCNELKVMGLDTKKTILPKYIQDALNDFLERYLDGEEWESVAVDVVKLKDILADGEQTNIFELGLPKGVNKVEYYKNELELDPAGARLPGHVRASLYYNRCLEKYQDKGSLTIVSSMKIKVFYLETPDGKTKSIALPVDLEEVPQWFLDNIDVSKRMQIERLVDKPLENILKAVGKEPPSHQTLFLEESLEF